MNFTLSAMRFALALAVAWACASVVHAKDVCEPIGNSSADTACSHKKLKRTEAKLNARYQKLLVELDEISKADPERLAELKPKLIAAQRAWVSFRQAQCKAVEVWYTNGKLQGALYFDCMRSHAERRIEELNSFTDYRT